MAGTRPGVGRMPTTPQKAAGTRRLPPKSVPSASQIMPRRDRRRAAAGRAAGEKAGFQGLRVAPNTWLKVLAPAANSGVLVLPMTIAPACLSRATVIGILVRHMVLEQGRAVGRADAGRSGSRP